MKDYYQILGVGKDASEEEIKKAFRTLAHQHHPDKEGGDEAKFKELNEAYQVLGNPERRAHYDRFGSAGPGFGGAQGASWEDVMRQAGFGSGGVNVDLGDMFGDLFGGRRQTRRQQGRDIEIPVTLTFKEAAFGASKDVEVETLVECDRCTGSGAEPGAGMKTCAACSGSGQTEQIQRTLLGQFRTVAACPTCKGKGQLPEKVCTKCTGRTVVRDRRSLTVNIPGGINNGQTVRIAGQGEAGVEGGPAGDLFVNVRVEQDENFKRSDEDVLAETEIPFSKAALGATIDVPTLDGEMSVKIPAGTQSGRIFRLKAKGAQKLQGRGRGDHLLTVHVRTPEKPSKKVKDLLKELGEAGE